MIKRPASIYDILGFDSFLAAKCEMLSLMSRRCERLLATYGQELPLGNILADLNIEYFQLETRVWGFLNRYHSTKNPKDYSCALRDIMSDLESLHSLMVYEFTGTRGSFVKPNNN